MKLETGRMRPHHEGEEGGRRAAGLLAGVAWQHLGLLDVGRDQPPSELQEPAGGQWGGGWGGWGEIGSGGDFFGIWKGGVGQEALGEGALGITWH
jgi:hypothetical protein